MTRSRTGPDLIQTQPKTRPLTGGPAVVKGGPPPLTVVDRRRRPVDRHRWPSLTDGPPSLTAVDRRSDGDSGDGDETVPTPRGTTQVVTRGLLIIVCRCGRYEVRGTVHVRWQYEVAENVRCQYEVLFQVAAGQSERDTWHLAYVSPRRRVSGTRSACMDPCQSLKIM
ncbi:hypothetical protein Tco_0847067 [Tanacetum coccineum]